MEEYGSPEEWLEHLGDLARREGRIASYLSLYFSLTEEHGISREVALTQALDGIDDDLRPEVTETIQELEKAYPGAGSPSPTLQAEMRKLLKDIGLDDPRPLHPDNEEGESG